MTRTAPRILSAARVHLIAPTYWLPAPWLVMGASGLVSILAAPLIGDRDLAYYGTGGLVLFYLALCLVYVQAMTALLPFAMGLSMTRRTFYVGTALFAAAQSLIYGVLFYLLLLIERATGGWGVGQPFFAGGWYTPNGSWTVANPALQVAIFAVPMFALALLGMFIGVVYRRFGPGGIYALATVCIIGGGIGVTGLILWLQGSFFGFFTEQSVVALFAGWPLLLAAGFGGAGYLCIRRVVP